MTCFLVAFLVLLLYCSLLCHGSSISCQIPINVGSHVLSIQDATLEVDNIDLKSLTTTAKSPRISGKIVTNLPGLQASTKASLPGGPTELALFQKKTLDVAFLTISNARLVLTRNGGLKQSHWKLAADLVITSNGGEGAYEFDVYH